MSRLPGYDEWIATMPGEECCPECLGEFSPDALEWVDADAEPGYWHGIAACPHCGADLHAYDVTDPDLITGGSWAGSDWTKGPDD